MKSILRRTLAPVGISSFLALLFFSPACAKSPTPSGPQDIKNVGKKAPTTFPKEDVPSFYAKPEDVKWFEDAKFGIFVHWDPSCLEKAEISWGRKGARPGCGAPAADGIPQEIYDTLYRQFNPTNFNADEWIRMVRNAGAEYFIFTTKHHGGFCMFDAPGTTFKITNTPFKRDVCKELADACHKYGIKLFWYYSQPDWHHPDYLTPHHDRYRKYMYAQLRKLLTDYGKVDGIWFDCLNTTWKHWDSPRMIKMIRELQPGILINSRWGWGMPIEHNGDFNNPEQEIGKFDVSYPWETCFTMGRGWSWRGGGDLMSADACTRMLIQCVGSGGNLALDCGPRPDGKIDPPEAKNYLAMGRWLKDNGESIYGTRAGPYKPGLFGVSTHKGNKIYLHVLASSPPESEVILTLPPLPEKPSSAQTLDGRKIQFAAKKDRLLINLSDLSHDPIDNVVVLTLPGEADGIDPIAPNPEPLPTAKAEASSEYGKDHSVDALVTGGEGEFRAGIRHKKTWVAHGNGEPQWVVIEFEKPETVGAVSLAEPQGRFLTRKFDIEYEATGAWKKLYSGTEIGPDFSLLFPSVKTKKLRLHLLEYAPHDPGLRKFEAYPAY